MNISTKILLLILMLISINSYSQFQYTEDNELISFSYLSEKIIDKKNNEDINTLNLPGYNNDSLYWVNNIFQYLPNYHSNNCIVIGGFSIDTAINFFRSATKIKINEGYVWIYKIYSPTAFELGFQYENCFLDSNEYLSIHSNYTDSISGPLEFHIPEILHETTSMNYGKYASGCDEKCNASLIGNILFVEYFSTKDNPGSEGLTLSKIFYHYPTSYRLSDAPKWIREKYPEINFDRNEKK